MLIIDFVRIDSFFFSQTYIFLENEFQTCNVKSVLRFKKDNSILTVNESFAF